MPGKRRSLYGLELRYALTFQLFQHGAATVPELIDALHYHHFAISGRASKAVSDALRWEIAHGRVRRLARGRYAPGGCRARRKSAFATGCWHCAPKRH
ncbi:hypothetical protein ACVWWN_000499 [Mycobacterium sp. URHB0021]